MALRNQVLFGLKVSFNFSDIESKVTALENLGLDVRDLEVIRGVSDSIDKIDLQNISGLDVNLTRYLDRLSSDSSRYRGIVNDLSGYQFRTKGNFEAFGPISGGAVRYKYIPNDAGDNIDQSSLKYGDISTSRVSSWSSATADETNLTQAISYGASVQVKRDLKVGQNSGFAPGTGEAIINVLDTPEPIRFATEVPTDLIELDINGTQQFVYAMRGIPIVFTTAFKNLSMNFKFNPFGVLDPIFTFQATDGSEQEITSTPNVSDNTSQLRYNAQSYKEREIRLYYPPNNIETIVGRSINLRFFPKVKFINLELVDLQTNLLGEMPDWTNIAYDGNYDSSLTNINVSQNPLYQADDEELRTLGTPVVERLPKTLTNLVLNGTYNGNTTFYTADESLVLYNITQAEYNSVTINKNSTQNIDFDIQGTTVTMNGVFWDKHFFDGIYYVYVRNPNPSVDLSTISGYTINVQQLDFASRCPNLQNLYLNRGSGRHIYRNSNSYYILPSDPYTKITGQEVTPRVNVKTIRTYQLYDTYFTLLNDVFINPSAYLEADEDSELRTFDVRDNEALTTPTMDFSKMSSISTIRINDTALPIPNGLQNRSSLRTFGATYTRFPNRNQTAASFDIATGEGNASNMNNFFFTSKNPSSFGQYVFSGCTNLSSLGFYASDMDGFIPKFTGNDSLSSIDLRNTNIEGGRPADSIANQGLHGRTYIMWDDTFEDAQSITSIRINSSVLGRNIGIYDSSTQTYSQASFQGSAFNLPLLNRIEILSSGGYIGGNFFNVGVAPSLKTLISYGIGWGSDLNSGTPLPTFAGNPNIEYIDLSDNNFSGNISLSNLSKLKQVYLSSNDLSGITGFNNLNALTYFIIGNNPNLTGNLPNFSTGSPNIQYISINNCDLNSYPTGSLTDATRLRSLDLSNNQINQSNIDQILLDLLDNWDQARRSGVTINLLGNSAPSRIVINTPTQTTSTAATQTITVSHPAPTPNFGPDADRDVTISAAPTASVTAGQYIVQNNTGAYGKVISVSGTTIVIDSTDTSAASTGGASGTFNTTDTIHVTSNSNSATNNSNKLVDIDGNDVLVTDDPGIEQIVVSYTPNDPLYQFPFSINIRTGFDPPGGNDEYQTIVYQDNVDITSLVSIDFAGDVITYPGNSPGNVTNYPPNGAVIKVDFLLLEPLSP